MSRYLAFHLSVLNGTRKQGLMFAINLLHFGGDNAVVGGDFDGDIHDQAAGIECFVLGVLSDCPPVIDDGGQARLMILQTRHQELIHRFVVMADCRDQELFLVAKRAVKSVTTDTGLRNDNFYRRIGVTVPPENLCGVG